jgi:hypothetical protein
LARDAVVMDSGGGGGGGGGGVVGSVRELPLPPEQAHRSPAALHIRIRRITGAP